MAIPDYQSLMLPVLRHAASGETRVPDVAEKIAKEFSLTEEEQNQLLPSGRQHLLNNRIHWAKFYMVKAGLIEQPRRGRFVASDAGRQLLARNPAAINVDTLLEYPSFRDFYQRERPEVREDVPSTSAASADETPEEQIEAAHLTLHSSLRDELLQRILQNSSSFFEQIIVELLVAMGYGGTLRNAATQLGRAGDGGVDGVINEDRLGLDRVYVQAKRYSGTPVGRPDVQAFVGSLVGLGATKGVFVTTSTFSNQASEFVRHLKERVILIDGQRLADLMIEHNVGVRLNRSVEFKRLDEDFFTEDE
jgi:restriction system protein